MSRPFVEKTNISLITGSISPLVLVQRSTETALLPSSTEAK